MVQAPGPNVPFPPMEAELVDGLPTGDRWRESTVGAILANPKYTGHMVYGRRRKTGRTHVPVPPDRWIWSPEPAHPAIIIRELWDQAQAIGAEHRSASDALASTQPRARRNYPLRSRIRCNDCRHALSGVQGRPG